MWPLSAAQDGRVRPSGPFSPRRLPRRSWLPELAEALAGRRLREDGTLQQVPAERWFELNQSLCASHIR
jgi:hypothetical protein